MPGNRKLFLPPTERVHFLDMLSRGVIMYTVRIQLIHDETSETCTQQVSFEDHSKAYIAATEAYDMARELAVNGAIRKIA